MQLLRQKVKTVLDQVASKCIIMTKLQQLELNMKLRPYTFGAQISYFNKLDLLT